MAIIPKPACISTSLGKLHKLQSPRLSSQRLGFYRSEEKSGNSVILENPSRRFWCKAPFASHGPPSRNVIWYHFSAPSTNYRRMLSNGNISNFVIMVERSAEFTLPKVTSLLLRGGNCLQSFAFWYLYSHHFKQVIWSNLGQNTIHINLFKFFF